MGYRLENKEIDVSRLRKVTFVPSTKAGNIYRYKNMVLRIFDEEEKELMDEDTAKYLTSITTERIILPKKLLFYNASFRGYAMKLVSQKGSRKRLSTTPSEEFIDCVELLERDVETLSQKNILLNNINPGFTLYNGKLYIVNPINYTKLDVGNYETLKQLNDFQVHLLITELIAADLRKSGCSSNSISNMKAMMRLKDDDQKSSNYLRDLLKDQSNIKEYVKKIS